MAKVGAKKKKDNDRKVQVAFYTEQYKINKLGGMEAVREAAKKNIDELYTTKK